MTRQLSRIGALVMFLSIYASVCSGWVSTPSPHCQIRRCYHEKQLPPSFLSASTDSSKEFEEKVSSVATGSTQDDDIMAAAAAVTLEQCKLIGVKSLGVDYGLARTGLATTVGYNPEPLDIVEEYNSTLLAQDVVQTAASLQVSQIILGLPLHKNGTEQEQSSLTRTFGQELAAMAVARLGPNMKVMLWDERYTSREAAARAQADDPNRWVQGTLDADCACIILETYYDENGEGAEEIVLTDEQRTASLEIYERIKEYQAQGKIAALEKRESTMLKRKESIARAKKLEDEMRVNGTLGESNKKKRKKKKKLAKKPPSTWTAL